MAIYIIRDKDTMAGYVRASSSGTALKKGLLSLSRGDKKWAKKLEEFYVATKVDKL